MADERGIGESELVEEIKESIKDVLVYGERIQLYEGDEASSGVIPNLMKLYGGYLGKLYQTGKLCEMEKKYFGNVDFEEFWESRIRLTEEHMESNSQVLINRTGQLKLYVLTNEDFKELDIWGEED